MVELVAHRAGNATGSVAPAAAVADTIEVDVHRFRRRLEVRHAKVFWPTRWQWDRWWIDRSPAVPPSLRQVMDEPPVGTPLWLDLKGFTTRLTRAITRELTADQPVTMSSRSWWILRPARRRRIRTMRSVGSRWQLWCVLCIRRWAPGDGIAINERFLTPRILTQLLRGNRPVVAWGVTDLDRAQTLIAAGVQGLIVDDLELIATIRRGLDHGSDDRARSRRRNQGPVRPWVDR